MTNFHFIETEIKNKLAQCPFFDAVEYHSLLTSTSDRAKELAQNGASQGTVVLAGTQTKGRGRLGRRFYSPEGSGMYMSIILRPEEGQNDPGLLTACGAVAVWEAIRQLTDVTVAIKWVNDLYYNSKKLCGILAEGQFDNQGALSYVILGVGINITRPVGGYAPEIDDKTIALNEIRPEMPVDYCSLCAKVIECFGKVYNDLPDVNFLSVYREYSCVLNQNITYEKNGETHFAKAVAIDNRARLVVITDEGVEETLGSGEISLVRMAL